MQTYHRHSQSCHPGCMHGHYPACSGVQWTDHNHYFCSEVDLRRRRCCIRLIGPASPFQGRSLEYCTWTCLQIIVRYVISRFFTWSPIFRGSKVVRVMAQTDSIVHFVRMATLENKNVWLIHSLIPWVVSPLDFLFNWLFKIASSYWFFVWFVIPFTELNFIIGNRFKDLYFLSCTFFLCPDPLSLFLSARNVSIQFSLSIDLFSVV